MAARRKKNTITNDQGPPTTRKEALTRLRAIYSRARCQDPCYATPDYYRDLPDAALFWLCDYEAAMEGSRAPADRIGMTEAQRGEAASDRYKREETIKNRHLVSNVPPWDVAGIIEQDIQTHNLDPVPFISAGYKVPRKH